MRRLEYVLQFKGQAGPVEGQEGVMRATTTAAACRITTEVGADGLACEVTYLEAGAATFESEVRTTGETFVESGTIRFGDAASVRFSTVGAGALGESADPKLASGAIIWKVDEGDGQLAGATGYITSNFIVTDTGEVTDNQLGVFFLP